MHFLQTLINTFNEKAYNVLFFNLAKLFGRPEQNVPLIIFFIFASAIYFMVYLRFINITQVKKSLLLVIKGDENELFIPSEAEHVNDKEYHKHHHVSPLRALFAVIAGSAGLGSIVNTCAAMYVGGPGTVFWMCLAPFILTPIRFAEVYAAHSLRIKNNQSYEGNPGIYLKSGLKNINLPKVGIFLSTFYVITMFIGSFGGGSSFQSNQLVSITTNSFSCLENQGILISVAFSVMVAFVIFRGSKSIIKILSTITPYLIGLYFCISVIVIIKNFGNIAPAFKHVIQDAFGIQSIKGGVLFTALLSIQRMSITTESGLGTACSIHSHSSNKDSAKEAIGSMSSPIFAAFFVCFITMLVNLSSGAYSMDNVGGILMLKAAYATVTPKLTYAIVLIAAIMGFNCVIAWGFYGLNAFKSLFKTEKSLPFNIMYILAIFAGGIISDFDPILKFTDVVNTSAAIPNIVGLIFMSKYIKKGYLDYLKRQNKK